MTSQLSNPFVRKTKFQLMHSSTSSSLSNPYIIGPNTTMCPKKKYSKNQWYDYKSSHLQLSQKIVYRMNAQFYRLQSLQIKDSEQLEHGSCLLHTQLKKSPFERRILLNQEGLHQMSKTKNETDWTDLQSKVKFSGPESIRNYTETMKQYGLMRTKIQAIKSEKLVSNSSLFDIKNANKVTFGADQKFIPTLPLQESEKYFLKNATMTQSINNLQPIQPQAILLPQGKSEGLESKTEQSPTESKKQLRLKQSCDTFALKNYSKKQLKPQKIKYKNVTYFLVPLKKQESH